MTSKDLRSRHKNIIEKELFGRYISPVKVNDILSKLSPIYHVHTAGYSVQNRPIKSVTFGRGKTKILMWSQMHGNESTTTKALFDLFNFLQMNKIDQNVNDFLDHCTFLVIPMLNPDGSYKWTRENANRVDLNRDASDLSQPESKILNTIFKEFKPDYCFNLHGQRSIYGFEDTGKPSVLSFLAPAANASRTFTLSRKRATFVISHITKVLSPELIGQIGLYDDTYNGNCVGDAFQRMGAATILFEAGHYPNDYDREVTRAYVFGALITAIDAVVKEIIYPLTYYNSIPKHSKCYCDLHKVMSGKTEKWHYNEVLKSGKVCFEPIPLSDLMGNGLYAHKSEM